MPALADSTTRNAEPTPADYRWNLDAFNRAHRRWLIETAPADLNALTDTALVTLDYACGAAWYETTDVAAVERLRARVLDERTARGLNTPFDRRDAA